MVDIKQTIKRRCGIAEAVTIYDNDIQLFIDDCKEDMIAAGVPPGFIEAAPSGVVTAVTLYVRAHLGDDRSDTNRYIGMYRQKVSRLILEDEPGGGISDVE